MPHVRMLRNETGSFPNGTFQNNTTADDPKVLVMIGLMSLMLLALVLTCNRRSPQGRASTDKRSIARRYRTVDAWLITKVCEMICY
jgi:hypothetical protein